MTRIAVFSDTHGNRKTIRESVQQNGPFDMLLHLGDGVCDGEAVAAEMGLMFRGVQGNEDYGCQTTHKTEEIICAGQWRFLAVHGHQMDINPYQPEDMWQQHIKEMVRWAKQRKAQVFLFGHSHNFMLREERNIIICNPGDQYIGSQTLPTFAVINTDDCCLDIRILRKADGNAITWNMIETIHGCSSGVHRR